MMIAVILLLALNGSFFLGGGLLFIIGIMALAKPQLIYGLASIITDEVSDVFGDLKILNGIDLSSLIKDNATVIIIIGIIILAIGFLGTFGALRKSTLLLTLYAYFVLGILCLEMILAIYGSADSDKIEAKIKNGIKLSLIENYMEGMKFAIPPEIIFPQNAKELAWDAVQVQAVCCGVSSYTDWDDMINWNKTYPGITDSAKLPLSCCKIKRDSRTKEFKGILFGDFINSSVCLSSRKTGTYNTVSCYDRLRTFILNNKVIIIATFVIVILVQMLAIGCACWLKFKLMGKKSPKTQQTGEEPKIT